jgi:hypothetical protein
VVHVSRAGFAFSEPAVAGPSPWQGPGAAGRMFHQVSTSKRKIPKARQRGPRAMQALHVQAIYPITSMQPCASAREWGGMVLEDFASGHDGRLATHGECHDI